MGFLYPFCFSTLRENAHPNDRSTFHSQRFYLSALLPFLLQRNAINTGEFLGSKTRARSCKLTFMPRTCTLSLSSILIFSTSLFAVCYSFLSPRRFSSYFHESFARKRRVIGRNRYEEISKINSTVLLGEINKISICV